MKLSPTMLAGLQKMAKRLERQSAVMAEPNEATGRALHSRGLIEVAVPRKPWPLYRLTDAGRQTLAASGGRT